MIKTFGLRPALLGVLAILVAQPAEADASARGRVHSVEATGVVAKPVDLGACEALGAAVQPADPEQFRAVLGAFSAAAPPREFVTAETLKSLASLATLFRGWFPPDPDFERLYPYAYGGSSYLSEDYREGRRVELAIPPQPFARSLTLLITSAAEGGDFELTLERLPAMGEGCEFADAAAFERFADDAPFRAHYGPLLARYSGG